MSSFQINSNSSIMSIQEMIDVAFGEADKNVVNFKLIHSILYILARQLQLLQRRVRVEIAPFTEPVSSTILISEIKLKANVSKHKRKLVKATKSILDNATLEKSKKRPDKSEIEKSSELTTSKSTEKTSSPLTTDKTTTSSQLKTLTSLSSAPIKTTTEKSTTHQSSTDKTFTQQSSTERSLFDKTISSREKLSTDGTKVSGEKSSSDGTKSSTEKLSSDETKTLTEKSSSDRTKPSGGKTSEDITKSSIEKLSSEGTKPSREKSSSDKTQSLTEKSYSDETKTLKEKSSSDKTKPSGGKSSADITKSSIEKLSSEGTKPSREKSSSDKTKSLTEKSYSDETKSLTEKLSSHKRKSSTEKSYSDETKTLIEKSSSDRTKPSGGKSSADITKSSTEKLSSEGTKPSRGKSSSDKTQSLTEKSYSDEIKSLTEKSSSHKRKSLTEKSYSDETKTLTEKSSSDRTKPSGGKSSADITKSSTEKLSSEGTKPSREKSSSDKTKSLTEKSYSDERKSSTEKASSDKTKSSSDRTSTKESLVITSDDYRKKLSFKDYHHLLDDIEQQREQELRVVNQRADSREEAKKIPTPIVSLDEMEAQYEKLLIVERVPIDTDTQDETDRSSSRTEPVISVVTQDQFDSLAEVVKELQQKFAAVGKAEFPENIQLMQELRRGASLTDAMAALQLSSRIEAVEKALEQMMSLVTDLAVTKGMDITEMLKKDAESPDTKVLFGAGTGPIVPTQRYALQGTAYLPLISRRSEAFQQPSAPVGKSTITSSTHDQRAIMTERVSVASFKEVPQHIDSTFENIQSREEIVEIETEAPRKKPNWITPEELEEAIMVLNDKILKTITISIRQSSSTADAALKIASNLERKIDNALNMSERMDDVEALVAEYTGHINTLDTGFSSYITDYQEQLTQMQHDLEGGLESMAEAMANIGGDTAAVTELNINITNLQLEFDITNLKQKELKEQQSLHCANLENLWKEIEILRGTKSDREEVADALRDKAGLGALNGLVSRDHFDAVRGDFEKRIGAAYDKFNNQEIIWQKIIDDLLRELNVKADHYQVVSLRDDVNDNLNMLKSRINAIMEIVGEPRSAAVTRRLFHDAACLSCSSPAIMNLEETNLIPALQAFPKPGTRQNISAEDKSKPRGDGDHGLCYLGQPIPHPVNPSSRVCNRYCGGSHTIITDSITRAPAGIIISSALRRTRTEIGTDGKAYMTDVPEIQSKPCLPCNIPKAATPQATHDEEASSKSASPSLDFLMSSGSITMQPRGCVSDTPPPPSDF